MSTDLLLQDQLRLSEQKHRVLFEDSPDAYLILIDGIISDCNKAAEAMLRGTRNQILGRSPAFFSPIDQPDGRKSAEAAPILIAEALRNGNRSFEWLHKRLDGSDVHVEVSISAMTLNEKPALFVSWRDITERKRAQEALLSSQRRLAQAMDLARVANWEYDVATDLFTFNDRFYTLYGTTTEREGGVRMSSKAYMDAFVDPADAQRVIDEIHKAATSKNPLFVGQIEFQCILRDGERRRHLARYESMTDAAGRSVTIFGSSQDITEQTNTEQALLAKTALLEAQSNASPDAMLVVDENNRRILRNRRMFELFNVPRHIQDCEDDASLLNHVAAQVKYPEQFLAKVRHLNEHGDLKSRDEIELKSGVTLDRYTSPVKGADGRNYGRVWIFRDITEQKQAADEMHKLSQVVEQTPTSVVITDLFGNIEYVNPAFTETYGYTAAEALGKNPRLLKSGLMPPEVYAELWGNLKAGRDWHGEFQNRHKDGRLIWQLVNICPLRNAHGDITHYVAVKENITARKAMEEQLRCAALTDRLTGLPNRALICDRLQQAVLRSKRVKGYHYGLLFLDFDRFKAVNDSFGHDIGDLLLREIATRLRAAVRVGDSVAREGGEHTTARLGGDEFVVLLDGMTSPLDATVVAKRMLQAFSQPYQLGEHRVYSTVSIGVVTSLVSANSAEEVLRDADTAMYEAKLAGKGQYVLFDLSMRRRVQKRLDLEYDLRGALENNQLFLMYQPIVSLQTGEVEGYEALVRWKHPEHGLISPGEFIPVAEESGLILPIGAWVLRQACQQFSAWRKRLGLAAPRSISVNISRCQLASSDLPDAIMHVLEQTGIAPDCLHLEITESAMGKDAAGVVHMLRAINAIGVKLDMDDFGTGYSSLACLREFPIDILKIDRSFVANIDRGREFAAMVQAVVQLARNLNVRVVAEGIETIEQATILHSLDCEFGQGYLFSKPLMADEVATFRLGHGSWLKAAS